MIRFVDWFAQRKALNLAVVMLYSLAILHMHDPMVNVSVWLMNYFTRQVYDAIVGTIACIFLVGIVFYFIKKLLQYRQAAEVKISYLLLIVSLLFLRTQINFVMNIELIHTVEFGLLALLIFPLTKRFGDTAFYALLVGMLDEWYQYKILYTEKLDNNYYDFNDLVLDLLGIGFMIVLLYSAGLNNKSYPPKRAWYQSPVLYITVVGAITISVLFQLSLIRMYDGDESTWLILNKTGEPQDFWNHLPNSDIVYHVMKPLEGTLLLVALLSLFFVLDHLARKSIATPTASAVDTTQAVNSVR